MAITIISTVGSYWVVRFCSTEVAPFLVDGDRSIRAVVQHAPGINAIETGLRERQRLGIAAGWQRPAHVTVVVVSVIATRPKNCLMISPA